MSVVEQEYLRRVQSVKTLGELRTAALKSIEAGDFLIEAIEKKKSSTLPIDALVGLFEKELPQLPAIDKPISAAMRRLIAVRLQEDPDMTSWETFFAHVKRCPFLLGKNQSGWRATLSWLLSEDGKTGGSNRAKVEAGSFDEHKEERSRSDDRERIAREAKRLEEEHDRKRAEEARKKLETGGSGFDAALEKVRNKPK